MNKIIGYIRKAQGARLSATSKCSEPKKGAFLPFIGSGYLTSSRWRLELDQALAKIYTFLSFKKAIPLLKQPGDSFIFYIFLLLLLFLLDHDWKCLLVASFFSVVARETLKFAEEQNTMHRLKI